MENKVVGFVILDINDGGYIDKNQSSNYDILDCTPFETKEKCLNALKSKDIFEIDNEYKVIEYELCFNTYEVEVNFELKP